MTAQWRMDVPAGWAVWEPGSPDVRALCAAATASRRAELTLARRIRVVEKEVTALPGNVRQVGVRVTAPRTGAVSGSMSLTQWARPTTDGGKRLNARLHLDALAAHDPEPTRAYRHREATVEKVPAGQLVLRNEVWRPRRRAGWVTELEATIFPRGSEDMFELAVRSRHADLQPTLMAELSLMAHSFRLDDAPA